MRTRIRWNAFLPILYRTLVQIAVLRDDVTQLRSDVGDAYAGDLFERLNSIEQRAVELIDALERTSDLPSH